MVANDRPRAVQRRTIVTFVAHLAVIGLFLGLWFSVVRSFHALYQQLHAADLPASLTNWMMRPAVVLAIVSIMLVLDGLVLHALDRSGKWSFFRSAWSTGFALPPLVALLQACAWLILPAVFSLPLVNVFQGDEVDALLGTYQLLRSERSGSAVDATSPRETLVIEKGGRYAFIAWTLGDETTRGHFTLDLKSPPRLCVYPADAKHLGQRRYGLYEVDGDRLTICFSPLDTPLAQLPTTMATADNDNVVLVCQRTSAAEIQ